jgi:3-deoxy-7-phosphoheptulonate synthase
MTVKTDDLRIRAIHPLVSPQQLEQDLPLPDDLAHFVVQSRQAIKAVLNGHDDRLLVIIGPCSIHDVDAGLEYARRLAGAAEKYRQQLLIVLRVYFEKPRTTVGWKGLINDPDLDGSFQINKGLHQARKFLLDVTTLGLPAATEFLDTTFGQYYTNLISLGAIGARTTESQIHRELASGLSMPVGFKNRTDGDIQVAVDSIIAGQQSHSFPSLTKQGTPAILETSGNPDCFMILRGGSRTGENYHAEDIQQAEELMQKKNLVPAIVVDCSHANSRKDYRRQSIVLDEVCNHIRHTTLPIRGVMIESHLVEGQQKAAAGKPPIYGQSITDGCIGWETSEHLLQQLADAVVAKQMASAKPRQ